MYASAISLLGLPPGPLPFISVFSVVFVLQPIIPTDNKLSSKSGIKILFVLKVINRYLVNKSEIVEAKILIIEPGEAADIIGIDL
jgi:hypothetical protein